MSARGVVQRGLRTPTGPFLARFFTQDLISLKYEVPMQYHTNGSYLMNQRTFALLITMSDATGRPLLTQLPQGHPGFLLDGSRIVIATQMPDVAPGAVPVAYGDWRAGYTLANRRATTMMVDPYSAGWCNLYKF